MSFIIQATTISGSIIEKARWVVQPSNPVLVGQTISVYLKTDDKNILSEVAKRGRHDGCCLEEDDGSSHVVITFISKQISHMIDEQKLDTICIVVPSGRHAEQVMLYLLDPEKCDRRFIETVRQG